MASATTNERSELLADAVVSDLPAVSAQVTAGHLGIAVPVLLSVW